MKLQYVYIWRGANIDNKNAYNKIKYKMNKINDYLPLPIGTCFVSVNKACD